MLVPVRCVYTKDHGPHAVPSHLERSSWNSDICAKLSHEMLTWPSEITAVTVGGVTGVTATGLEGEEK